MNFSSQFGINLFLILHGLQGNKGLTFLVDTEQNWPLSKTRNIAYFGTFSGIAPNYKSGSCQGEYQNAGHDAKLCPVPT